ncbi:MAG TPA: Crp/Fnr family transcriptional regulator [Sphingopyxis sp.]|nr:Crp/Fnr family transcriptional regulator [Sphingopyxis sp.]
MNARQELETVLGAGAWFAALPPDVRAEMLAIGTARTIESGKYLYEEQGEPSGLHGLITGTLHIIGLSADGNAVTLGITRPGDWTGFLSCIDGLPHAYSAIAREKSRVFSLRPADVTRIFERDVPTFRLLIAPDLTIRRKLGRYIVDDVVLPLAQRVAARLGDLGRSPYDYPVGPIAPLRNISQEELAMSVAATRPRINEILRDFAARGLIELGYGRITVIDPDALGRFARDG